MTPSWFPLLRFAFFCFAGAAALSLVQAAGAWNLPPAGLSIVSFLVGGAVAYLTRRWIRP